MAVVTTKSSIITNRDGGAGTLNSSILDGGRAREKYDIVAAANGDSATSKYIICQVPTNCRVTRVLLWSDALGGSAAGDVGVYRTTADGGAAVDADFFATAAAVASAVAGTDITNESTTNTLIKRGQPLWQALGVASDPGGFYDIVITLTAATAAAGSIGLTVAYVENN